MTRKRYEVFDKVAKKMWNAFDNEEKRKRRHLDKKTKGKVYDKVREKGGSI